MHRLALGTLVAVTAGLTTLAAPAGAGPFGFRPYFVAGVKAQAESVAVADVNGDGFDDVLLTTSHGVDAGDDYALFFYPQSQTGTLGVPTRYDTLGGGGDPMGVAAGDVNGDGIADVAVATSAGVQLWYGGPNGPYGGTIVHGRPAHQVEIDDLDGTPAGEIVATGPAGVTTLRQADLGAPFVALDVSPLGQTDVAVGEVTGDGFPDIVGFLGRTVHVFPRIPGAGFGGPVPFEATTDGWCCGGGLVVGDIDADGTDDVALSIPGGGAGALVNLWRQREPGQLGQPSAYPAFERPEALAAADLDGDGRLELAMAHGGQGRAGIWWSEGSQDLYEVPYTYRYGPSGLALGDVDGDGRGDLVLADPANGLVVLPSSPALPDTDPPETTLLSGPIGPIRESSVTFTFESDELSSTFSCSIDGSSWSTCSSPRTYTGVPDGSYEFRVRATDQAGNVDPTPAARRFTVDTRPPDTTITDGPSGAVSASSATFSFVSTEPGSRFECSLNLLQYAACASPTTYSNLPDGGYLLRVRAVDGVGNVDQSPAARGFTVDTRAPDTSITDGPSGTITSPGASFAFTGTETGVTFECALGAAPFTACTSPKSYSDLADGGHEFRVRAVDAAGNVDPSPAARQFTVERPSDLAVVISASPDPVKYKGELNYTVTVSNKGPADSSGVTLTQTLPAPVTVTSVTPAAGTCAPSGSTVSCRLGALPTGASVTLSVVVKVAAKHGSVLVSQAQVSGPRTDPDTADNSASVSTAVR